MSQILNRLEVLLSALAFTDAAEFGAAIEMISLHLPCGPGGAVS